MNKLEEIGDAINGSLTDMYFENTDNDFDAMPMIMCAKDDQMIVCVLAVEGGGPELRTAIDAIIAKIEPDAVGFVSPGWIKDPDDYEVRTGECVMVNLESRDGEKRLYMYEVKREPGKPPVLGQKTISDRGSEGRMTNLFKPENVTSH